MRETVADAVELGPLVGSEHLMVVHEVNQVLDGQAAVLRHHVGHGHLVPELVGKSDHAGLRHVGVFHQHALHLGRVDVLARRHYHVVLPGHDGHV